MSCTDEHLSKTRDPKKSDEISPGRLCSLGFFLYTVVALILIVYAFPFIISGWGFQEDPARKPQVIGLIPFLL